MEVYHYVEERDDVFLGMWSRFSEGQPHLARSLYFLCSHELFAQVSVPMYMTARCGWSTLGVSLIERCLAYQPARSQSRFCHRIIMLYIALLVRPLWYVVVVIIIERTWRY